MLSSLEKNTQKNKCFKKCVGHFFKKIALGHMYIVLLYSAKSKLKVIFFDKNEFFLDHYAKAF